MVCHKGSSPTETAEGSPFSPGVPLASGVPPAATKTSAKDEVHEPPGGTQKPTRGEEPVGGALSTTYLGAIAASA